MITLEEYQLSYNLYEAERELAINEAALELRSLQESIEILDEGAIETIKNFIKKIIEGIQNAWNKFRSNVSNTKIKYGDAEITKAIAGSPVNITVEDYIEYNTDVLDNLSIEVLNYSAMKNSLTSTEDFMKRYYNSIYKDANKSIFDNLRDVCIRSKKDKYQVTKEDLTRMYAYMKNHKAFLDKVEGDIKKINDASKATDYITSMIGESSILTESKQSKTRQKVLDNVVKVLKEYDITPKITPRNKKSWIETGNSGHFGGSLCIAGLGSDYKKLPKIISAVNKEIKSLGGRLRLDNYGCAFLSIKEDSLQETMNTYFTEDENAKPKIVSDEKKDNPAQPNDNQNKAKEDSEAVKAVQVYFKCISELLSAEMKISREIYYFYNSVVNKHMMNSVKNKVKDKVSRDEKKPTENKSSGAPTVKI